ncbi:hypothetical protein ACH5RR_041086 [Cinchona calisaya]|uniref:Uncharacterized protein n=1 Tax=Cinchona calisaya TaxID=153742 RepID=A0ABD2XVS4_9GENT
MAFNSSNTFSNGDAPAKGSDKIDDYDLRDLMLAPRKLRKLSSKKTSSSTQPVLLVILAHSTQAMWRLGQHHRCQSFRLLMLSVKSSDRRGTISFAKKESFASFSQAALGIIIACINFREQMLRTHEDQIKVAQLESELEETKSRCAR